MTLAAPISLIEAIEQVERTLTDAEVFLGHGTDNPWDEAVFLVLGATGRPLHTDAESGADQLTQDECQQIDQWLLKRCVDRLPLPYIAGRAWFAGLEFICDQRALVPRSPIAQLIENQFSPWWREVASPKILDLCCGGGSLGILSALAFPNASVVLADIDTDALALARENVQLHNLADRVELIESDVLSSVPNTLFDVIICNPPYVDSIDMEALPIEYRHEPSQALASGSDGLDFSRLLLAQLPRVMHASTIVVLELGNSWEHFEALFPQTALTWLEFEHGGWGVCVLTLDEVEELGRQLR